VAHHLRAWKAARGISPAPSPFEPPCDSGLANALEGIAQGFAGQGDGLSIGLLKVARDLRNDEAMGDIPMPPNDT